MGCLLSLGYVVEHPNLPWLLIEPEKVGAFETRDIERRIRPSGLYRGVAGRTRRYFPLKLPVALDAEGAVRLRRTGHDTLTVPSTWPDAHTCLWEALPEHHRSVHEFDLAQAILECRARTPGPSEGGGNVRVELVRIERAILRGTPEILEEFAGLPVRIEA